MLALVLASAMTRPVATMVLIHGAGGGGWEYAPWRMHFERRGYKFLAPDLIPREGDYARTTLADYDSQIVAWCEGARRPLVLVGASMGGALALRVANRVGADAVVLVNPVTPSGIASPGEIPDVVRWAGGPIQDTREALPDGSERTILWAAARWRDESGVVLRDLRDGYSFDPIAAPILVVVSGQDADVPPQTSLALATELGAQTIEYPEASHIGPLMGLRAHRTAKDILDWLFERAIVD